MPLHTKEWNICTANGVSTPLGRMFGYGTLRLTQRGKNGAIYVPNVPRVQDLYDEFMKIVADNNRGHMTT